MILKNSGMGMNILAGTLYFHRYAVSESDPGRSYGTVRVPPG